MNINSTAANLMAFKEIPVEGTVSRVPEPECASSLPNVWAGGDVIHSEFEPYLRAARENPEPSPLAVYRTASPSIPR